MAAARTTPSSPSSGSFECERTGTRLHVIDRFYPSSNTLTHFIGAWLKEQEETLSIEVKQSRFDEEKI